LTLNCPTGHPAMHSVDPGKLKVRSLHRTHAEAPGRLKVLVGHREQLTRPGPPGLNVPPGHNICPATKGRGRATSTSWAEGGVHADGEEASERGGHVGDKEGGGGKRSQAHTLRNRQELTTTLPIQTKVSCGTHHGRAGLCARVPRFARPL
jgi:hypothetical protein